MLIYIKAHNYLFFLPMCLGLFRRKPRKSSVLQSSDTVDWPGLGGPKGTSRLCSTSFSHAERLCPDPWLFQPKLFPSTGIDIICFSQKSFLLNLYCPSWIFTVTICFSCLRDRGSSPWDHLLVALSVVLARMVPQMLSNPQFPSLSPGASGWLFWKRVPPCIVRSILALAPVAPASCSLCQVIMNI